MPDLTTIVIDFETYSELPIEHGAWNYAKHPSTLPLILSYKINDGPIKHWHEGQGIAYVFPDDLMDAILNTPKENLRIVAHNYWFEFCIWKFCCTPKFSWPPIPDECWFDTSHQCGMCAIPIKLEVAAKALKLTNKQETGKALIKKFSVPNNGRRILPEEAEASWSQFVDYCDGDVQSTDEIYRTLPKFKDKEYEFIKLTHKLNVIGIPIDVESAKIILDKVMAEKATYTEKISALTDGVITTVNQTARMKLWLKNNHDVDMPNFQAGTVEEALEGKYGDLSDDAISLLEMRTNGGKSSTAKYETMIRTVSNDGRIHGTILYHGARTGRYVGRGFQPQNLPKPSVKYESMDELIADLVTLTNDQLNEKYGSLMKAASTAVRGMVQAPPGYFIVGADYAAIEARVLFWLANCIRGLSLYHKGQDPYIDMAAVIYAVLYRDIDDEQRWLGKQAILGCGYGLAHMGFINTCANYGVEIAKDLAKDTITSYRETYHEVPTLWDDLDKKSMLAVKTGQLTYAANGRIQFKTLRLLNGQKFLFMKLPGGRLITYPNVRIEKVKTPWGAMKNAITYSVHVNNQPRRESTYGGKLTENACQAIARDIMMAGTENADNAGALPFVQVHDELISLIEEGQFELSEYEDLICNPMPDWAKGLPLKAEGKVLTRYQKL